MSIQDGYAWFVAVVWPDAHGVPTARIFQWDRQSGRFEGEVDSFSYGSSPSFYEMLEAKYYEPVEGLLQHPVHSNGVQVALRRETVPVPVYA